VVTTMLHALDVRPSPDPGAGSIPATKEEGALPARPCRDRRRDAFRQRGTLPSFAMVRFGPLCVRVRLRLPSPSSPRLWWMQRA